MGAYSNIASAAGFATNFKPDFNLWGSGPEGSCLFTTCSPGTLGNTDPTGMNLAVVHIDGVDYFHVVVGDPASGFAMESYTRASGLSSVKQIPNVGGSFSPDGGGNESAVTGVTGGITIASLQDASNLSNSLGDYRVSGTGSNDPSKTVFRMVLTDVAGGMSLEVYKPFLGKKPRISQTIQDGGLTEVFVADMRDLSYSDSSTAAPIINNLVLVDPKLPAAGSADFEMALAQDTDVTAGRFTFTPGTGWDNNAHDPTLGWNSDGSTFGQGTYSYIGGQAFDPLTFNWASVFNYADNAISCSTPAGGGIIRESSGLFGGSCFNKP